MSILAFQMPEKVVMEKADDFHGLFTFKPLEKGYGVTYFLLWRDTPSLPSKFQEWFMNSLP